MKFLIVAISRSRCAAIVLMSSTLFSSLGALPAITSKATESGTVSVFVGVIVSGAVGATIG